MCEYVPGVFLCCGRIWVEWYFCGVLCQGRDVSRVARGTVRKHYRQDVGILHEHKFVRVGVGG